MKYYKTFIFDEKKYPDWYNTIWIFKELEKGPSVGRYTLIKETKEFETAQKLDNIKKFKEEFCLLAHFFFKEICPACCKRDCLGFIQ